MPVTVPPSTVPPLSTQEPPTALSTNTALLLLRVPVKFTTPPLRLRVPRLANVKLPPRFTVALVALIVPVLVQLPPKVRVELAATFTVPPLPQPPVTKSVPPLVPCANPWLLNGCPLTVMVPPFTSHEMVPWLTTATLAGP